MNNISLPIRPDIIGETLNYVLTRLGPYKDLTNIDQTEGNGSKNIRDTLVTVYKKYIGIDLDFSADSGEDWKKGSTNNVRAGDIILVDNSYYCITYVDVNNDFTTWPRVPEKYIHKIKNSSLKEYNIIRPNLANISKDAVSNVQDIAREVIMNDPDLSSRIKGDTLTFEVAKNQELREGYLQIGDIGFLVDPTQISFTTQNGYQFFPTVRTQGNPKIPTIQQIKDISISLIFPNEDAINYQLMNLVAMFKRTPFVNIRNKDICEFFEEVSMGTGWPDKWLSVALETIHIQSMDGFPNTVQAQISLLPFDSRVVSPGFKALRSMKDVSIQQKLIYRNTDIDELIRTSETKLGEQSITPERFLDVLPKTLDHSYNFKESLPFRSFYQSIIDDRNYVCDEMGNPEIAKGLDMEEGEYSIKKFRPLRPQNRLRHYKASVNNDKIFLTYKHIPGNSRDIGKIISDKRLEEQEDVLKGLTDLQAALGSKEDLIREMTVSFHTLDDAFHEIAHRFERANDLVPRLLGDLDITLDSETKAEGGIEPINGLFGLAIRGALQGITQKTTFLGDLYETFVKGDISKDAPDYLGALHGLTYYGIDRGIDNEGGLTTVENHIEKIWNWIDAKDPELAEERKAKFSLFLARLRNELNSEYNFIKNNDSFNISVMLDPTGAGPSPFKVTSIPIDEESFMIDGDRDVITSWGVVFSNKFVPINLQAFKYPYYQHMGSDDAVLNLTIKSLENSTLKKDLSLLSERIYETNKILMLNAPELITYMDGRVRIDTPSNHMFKAFGVYQVVINNSNTTSDPNNPGCWDTNISLTQANFTIEQYHKIEHVPTNNVIKQELAKLIARMEIDRSSDDERIVIKSYKERTIPSDDNMIDVSNFSNQLSDINDLNIIVRLKFVLSKNGETLSKYIDEVSKSLSIRAINSDRRSRNIFQITPGNEKITNYSDIKDFDKDKLKKIAEDLQNEMKDVYSASTEYQGEAKSIIGKKYYVGEDKVATAAINELVTNYPMFDKILRYIINKFDNNLEQQTTALINLVAENRSFFELFMKDKISAIDSAIDIATGKKPLKLKIDPFFILKRIIYDNPLSRIIGLAGSAINAASQSLAEKKKIDLVNTFDKFFLRLLENLTTSNLYHFASQIFRDPVIRDKFIKAGVITTSSADVLREAESKLFVNCYNDFDLPPMNDGNYSLSPDFYLYNRQLDLSESSSYINEAIKRHARIGKLTSMMALQENIDVINSFQEVIDTVDNIDTDVIKGISPIILDNGGDISDLKTASEVANSVRTKLDKAFVQLSRATNDLSDGTISDERQKELIELYKTEMPREEAKNKKQWDEDFAYFSARLQLDNSVGDLDERRRNLIYSARMKKLWSIFQRYIAINKYMEDMLKNDSSSMSVMSEVVSKYDEDGFLKKVFGGKNPRTKGASEIEALRDAHRVIRKVLTDAKDITTKNIDNYEEIKDRYLNGYAVSGNEEYLSLPGIKHLQNTLYNDIGSYIRLNTFLEEDVSHKSGPINFDSLPPDLKFLEFWNFREKDALKKRNELLRDFKDSHKKSIVNTNKLFPTFKLFFIEEDKGIWRSADDYYSHNAVQSIEIVNNKNSAGQTAVIRLSNVTNTLANKMSFYRESQDILTGMRGGDKNTFFGTLDLKPGTKIMIKMGYAPNDYYLDPLFVGRIIEMNAGPIVELICQSFGSQLNHHIVAEHFGLLATKVREYGDVASTLLDSIPGLEGLGKMPMYGDITSTFSGKNVGNIGGKAIDRFLLGTLLGSVSAMTFAQDNPRDENIFLPFNMVPETFHRPTFDWLVYDQSVWEALQEMSLYVRNTRPLVRLYNNDGISTNGNIRETLIIGDKSGYYKYTDAFSLSSMNIKEIDKARALWNRLKESLESIDRNRGTFGRLEMFEDLDSNIALNPDSPIKSEFRPLFMFLQDRTSALLLLANILDKINIQSNSSLSISNLIMTTIESLDIYQQFGGVTQLVNSMLEFSSITNIESEYDLVHKNIGPYSMAAFERVINALIKVNKKYSSSNVLDISEESYYNIRELVSNTDEKVSNDLRYKKIQQHHLITDVKDIISNNIALNTQFSNAVNIYFTGEPKMKNASLEDVRESIINKDINIWEVKAFGDTKDEHLRVLNSYQKNIDTNWLDIAEARNKLFKGYGRVKLDHGDPKNSSEFRKLLSKYNENFGNKNVPRWDAFPSFVVVGVSLLQKEVEKMYQGTIEIVGNPNIKPYDIIHLQDYTNDMHGTIEVEEVVHSFTPEGGFRTVITPNLITYDRDPIQLQDIQIINNISQYANTNAFASLIPGGIAAGGIATVVGVGALAGASALTIGATGGIAALPLAPFLYNSTIANFNKHHKFLYDQMGAILGRDCINFTTLIYHGMPYIAGFDGVDYTNLKTLINHKVEGIQNPLARFAAFQDPYLANISTNFNPGEFGIGKALWNNLTWDWLNIRERSDNSNMNGVLFNN